MATQRYLIPDVECKFCSSQVETVEFRQRGVGWDFYYQCRGCGTESRSESSICTPSARYLMRKLEKITKIGNDHTN